MGFVYVEYKLLCSVSGFLGFILTVEYIWRINWLHIFNTQLAAGSYYICYKGYILHMQPSVGTKGREREEGVLT